MSLNIKAIDRLFHRLAATYGASWTRQWEGIPIGDVKTAWAHELAGLSSSLSRIAWALENLPDRVPNAVQFKKLCWDAPSPETVILPMPKADPARVAAELAKLSDVKAAAMQTSYDGKAWAKRILERAAAGDVMTPIAVTFAKQAMGLAK